MKTATLFGIDGSDILMFISISILIFLILREFHCWYWKVNARLSTQQDMSETLEDILEQLVFITDYIKKKDPSSEEANFNKVPIDSTVIDNSEKKEIS